MVDENRIDLGAELGNLGASDDLIADIRRAAGAEKLRIEAVQTKERKKAKIESSKKLYIIVAVVAAVVLIAIAAFVQGKHENAAIKAQNVRPGVAFQQPTVYRPLPGAPTARIAPPPPNSQAAPPPAQDGSEQPSNPM